MAGYGVGSDAHIKVQTEALIERAENAKSAISTMENRQDIGKGKLRTVPETFIRSSRKQCRKFFRS